MVSMVRWNSLCELVLVMCFRIYGMMWCLMMSIIVMKVIILFSVSFRVSSMVLLESVLFLLFRMLESVGISISVSIMVIFLMIS